MAGDWLEELLAKRDVELQETSEKREQQLMDAKRLVAISRPVWVNIKKRLVDRIEQFNRKMPPQDQIAVVEGTAEFTLQLEHKGSIHGFIVSFTPAAGVINYGIPSGQDKWLSIKIDENSNPAIKENPTGRIVKFDEVDEVILRDYLSSFLRGA